MLKKKKNGGKETHPSTLKFKGKRIWWGQAWAFDSGENAHLVFEKTKL